MQSDEVKLPGNCLAHYGNVIGWIALLGSDVVVCSKGLRKGRLIVPADVPLAFYRGLFGGDVATTHPYILAGNRPTLTLRATRSAFEEYLAAWIVYVARQLMNASVSKMLN